MSSIFFLKGIFCEMYSFSLHLSLWRRGKLMSFLRLTLPLPGEFLKLLEQESLQISWGKLAFSVVNFKAYFLDTCLDQNCTFKLGKLPLDCSPFTIISCD